MKRNIADRLKEHINKAEECESGIVRCSKEFLLEMAEYIGELETAISNVNDEGNHALKHIEESLENAVQH